MEIKTQHLILKPISDSDRAAIGDILKDEKVKQTYIVPDFKSEDEVDKVFQSYKRLSLAEEKICVGVFLKTDESRLIGIVHETDRAEKSLELGWAFNSNYHNKGYATEAVLAVIPQAFSLGFCEVVAGAFSENPASIRVMEKCGMSRIEKTEEIDYRGKIHTCVFYSIKR